ncbi:MULTISPECIES: NAD(P)H-flavin reductase [Paraburkholderia]|jgi:CDP-4-dehydro-6-deoxyglucose reductase|uniref:CDP-4-dehydro-6-deoxyglucose reductase n=1 Tax=Paraburkholderia phenazinium TaxID=60549 RepID=A0A1N6KCC1_9BURK|nr:CDP-4-dehydro-6-deoxyglucose reductase [Paraburkholderia phenazinium]
MIRTAVTEDLQLRVPRARRPHNADEFALIQGTVVQIERCVPGVTILRIRVEEGCTFAYTSGQYIEVKASDGRYRCFSLATSCLHEGCIELHVRRVVDGLFSDHTLRRIECGDVLSWRGPFGDFGLHSDTVSKSALFLCTGTGFAPVRAIVEEAFSKGWTRPMSLYWGGRTEDDLYMCDLVHSWTRIHDNFRFIPVFSRVGADADTPRGTRVHEAVLHDFASLADVDVYACGAPAMVATAHEALSSKRGLRAEAFFADPFGATVPACGTASDNMDVVQIKVNGIVYAVPLNESLLGALRRLGVAVPSVCGGRGACGTCLVEIDAASCARLPPPGRDERELLECLPEATGHSRLACQIRVDASTSGLALSIP